MRARRSKKDRCKSLEAFAAVFCMSMSCCSIDDDRRVLFDILIDFGSVGWRQVDAAVGAVAPVDLAAEAVAPWGVVQADVAVERHPVLDFGVVALAAQRRVACLVGQAVDASRRRVAAARVARDEVALEDALAVLVEPEVLIRQADLDVARAPVVLGVHGGCLRVDWLAGRALFCGEQLQEMRRLGLLVDAPAVVAEEVRKLAAESQEAAEKISNLIGTIQSQTENAVQTMNAGTIEVQKGAEVVKESGTAFKRIIELNNDVAQQVKGIAQTTEEAAKASTDVISSVQNVEQASKNVSDQTQTVSAATEEQSASMEEIASASRNLAEIAQKLNAEVNSFKV